MITALHKPQRASTAPHRTRDRSSPSAADLYFQEIHSTPLLSAQEERRLARRIAKGDCAARDLMVRANLRLVVNIARRYVGRGVELLDLIAEGNLGLLRAVETFDPKRNCRFSTYATHWIRQAVAMAVVRTGQTIRLPVYMVSLLTHWRRATARLNEELGRPPTQEEVAERLQLPLPKLQDIHKAFRIMYRPHQHAEMTEQAPLEFQVEDSRTKLPDEELIATEDRHLLLALVDRMGNREAMILRWRFGLEGEELLTLEEIGLRLGVTRERVRQIEMRALAKLRECLAAG